MFPFTLALGQPAGRPACCPAARRLARAASLALALAAGGALAAPPTTEFALSPAQMQALGISVLKLEQPAALRGLAFPARVVLPPSAEQVVSAPVGGVVDQLLVSGQESVRAGQPLLRLASPEFGDLQLRLMEAAAKARLTQQALAREQALFAEGIIPERRVQEAQAAQRADAARLAQAQAELRLAGAEPALARRLAEGGAPEDALLVRARAAGQVLSVDVRPGQRVHQADPLARLASVHELWLDIQVPADRQVAMKGEITLVGREAAAVPVSLGAVASDSQTLVLRARVVRGAALLRPGEAVQAQVPSAAATGWALPLKAVTRQDGRSWVFVRSARGFVATPVTVLASNADSVQVSGALQPGQELAASGIAALKAAWLGVAKGAGE